MNVHLVPPDTVVPGATGTAAIVVENDSDVVRSYKLSVVGLDNWAHVVSGNVKLFPGETAEATVVFRAPANPTVLAGDHPFAVRCEATDDRNEVRVEESMVTVARHDDVELKLRPECGRARRTGRFRLTVVNTGNHRQRLGVDAQDNDDILAFDIIPAALTLEPGESATVRVRARQSSAQPGETLPFRLLVGPAKAPGGAAAGSLRVRRSVLGKVVAALAAVLALILVAAAISRGGTPSEAKDVQLATTTTAASTTTLPAASSEPTTTAAVPVTTVPAPTTTVIAVSPPVPTTTAPPAPVAATTTVPTTTTTVVAQPDVVATTTTAAATTTTAFTPITLTTVLLPPIIFLPVVTTTAPPPPPVVQHSFQDITVTYTIGPFVPFPLPVNCQQIHLAPEDTVYTSTVTPGWTIDTSKGDPGHPGITDQVDLSNLEAKSLLQNYDYQPSSGTTFAVTGTVCNPTPVSTAVFQHIYRVWLQRTV